MAACHQTGLLHAASPLCTARWVGAFAWRRWVRAEVAAEESLLALLKERVDVGRESTGLVALTLDGGRRIDAAYGRSDSADNRALDADTVFEIGSITKVFTALLL